MECFYQDFFSLKINTSKHKLVFVDQRNMCWLNKKNSLKYPDNFVTENIEKDAFSAGIEPNYGEKKLWPQVGIYYHIMM